MTDISNDAVHRAADRLDRKSRLFTSYTLEASMLRALRQSLSEEQAKIAILSEEIIRTRNLYNEEKLWREKIEDRAAALTKSVEYLTKKLEEKVPSTASAPNQKVVRRSYKEMLSKEQREYLMDTHDVALALGIPRGSVYGLYKRGVIPAPRINRGKSRDGGGPSGTWWHRDDITQHIVWRHLEGAA